jgi:two-component sensor histidine kinase
LNVFTYNLLNPKVHAHQSAHERRKARTLNVLNLGLAGSVLTALLVNQGVLGDEFIYAPPLVFLALALGAVALTHVNRYTVALLLFTLNLNLAILYANERHPVDAGPYLYYFPLIVSIILLNNPSFKDRFTLINLAIGTFFFILHLIIDIPGIKLLPDPAQTRVLWYGNLVLSVVSTSLLTLLLTWMIGKQNEEILIQNKTLKDAQDAVKSALKEKEVLLAELHHRVKNNLAIISGLLNLQSDATSNTEARQVISDSRNRIMSMALVHRMLFENPTLKNIDLGKYTSELVLELLHSSNMERHVDVNNDYDQVIMPVSKSIPLGLIVNEIVTNSIKYAFKAGSGTRGALSLSIKRESGSRVKMVVQDNGRGFPENYNFDHPSVSLGIFLIKTLAEQIDGEVRFLSDQGARIELVFTAN